MGECLRTTVVEDGNIVLKANDLGFILNEHGVKVAEVVSPSEVAIWDTHVCRIDDFGNVSAPTIGFLGTVQDGCLFDKAGRRVGEATGQLRNEAGAALLALNSLYPEGPKGFRLPLTPFAAQPEPFKVVQSRETIIYHEREEYKKPWGPLEFGLAFAAVSMLCMGLMVATVFVAVTIPIWATALAAAFIATNQYVKQHILEFAESDFIWADLRGIRAVKRKSVVIGLSVGLLVSSLYVFAAPDLANALCCLGAVLFALILMWWFLDRYGIYSIKTHIGRIQSGSPNQPNEYGKTNWVLSNSTRFLLGSAGVFALGMFLISFRGEKLPSGASSIVPPTTVAVKPESNPGSQSSPPTTATNTSPGSAPTSSNSASTTSSSGATDNNDLVKVDEFNLSVSVPRAMLGSKEVRQFGDRDHLAFRDSGDASVTYWVDVSKAFNDTPSWDHANDLDRRFKIAYKDRYRQIRLEKVDQGTLWEFELTTDGKTLHKLDLVGKTTAGRDLAVLFSASPESFEKWRELATKLVTSVEDYEDPGEGRNPVK